MKHNNSFFFVKVCVLRPPTATTTCAVVPEGMAAMAPAIRSGAAPLGNCRQKVVPAAATETGGKGATGDRGLTETEIKSKTGEISKI